jgi:hypothetical protein
MLHFTQMKALRKQSDKVLFYTTYMYPSGECLQYAECGNLPTAKLCYERLHQDQIWHERYAALRYMLVNTVKFG